MTDFPIFTPRRESATKRRRDALSLVRGILAAVVRIVEQRRARKAMRLPLKHMSDAQLHDIGLRRCDDRLRDRVWPR
jgi:uncharacterized protein YjiS (DUF1127 family)